jgi:PAS domain S-box-containing protein
MCIDVLISMSNLAGVFEASRCIASQRAPDELFAAVIRAVIEVSGARKGYLLLAEGEMLWLAAEGEVSDQIVNVHRHRENTPCSKAPMSIIANVQHARTRVVLADAAEDNPFSADPYLANEDVRSILCLPMTSQNDLVGLVYLENNSAPGVFTQERITFLDALIAQAITSLENALFCERLVKENNSLSAEHGELVFQRNLLRTLAETFPHHIYAKDTQTRFIFGNMAVAQGMGVKGPDELIGKTDFSFYPEECAAQYHQEEQAIIQSGRPLANHEERLNYLLANDVAWMLTTKVPLRDDNGKVVGIVGINYNITDRKKMEMELISRNAELSELNAKLSQAQAQLVQSEKLAAIGQLAAGVAHEINNPIGFIFSNVNTLSGYLEKLFAMLAAYEGAEHFINEEPITKYLRLLGESIDIPFLKVDIPVLMGETKDGIIRVRKIVQALTEFSRVGDHLEWRSANLHQGIDATLNIIHNEVKYKADVVKDYGQIPDVECLPSEINQVIMNLLVNAAHALGEERGRITIRTRAEHETVSIEISDTGCGIQKENLSRIFDPFYTTKAVGKGTGLGLSLSYSIVQKHDGTLGVESEVGRGTTFRLTLPIKRRCLHETGIVKT